MSPKETNRQRKTQPRTEDHLLAPHVTTHVHLSGCIGNTRPDNSWQERLTHLLLLGNSFYRQPAALLVRSSAYGSYREKRSGKIRTEGDWAFLCAIVSFDRRVFRRARAFLLAGILTRPVQGMFRSESNSIGANPAGTGGQGAQAINCHLPDCLPKGSICLSSTNTCACSGVNLNARRTTSASFFEESLPSSALSAAVSLVSGDRRSLDDLDYVDFLPRSSSSSNFSASLCSTDFIEWPLSLVCCSWFKSLLARMP